MKKNIILLFLLCVGFVSMADNNEPEEWIKYKINNAVFTDYNGESLDVSEIFASGKCILMDVATVEDYANWRRHEAGILEALQERFADELVVMWIENRDNIPPIYLSSFSIPVLRPIFLPASR